MYEDAPDDIVHDLLSKATYGNHSLGYPILGRRKRFRRLTAILSDSIWMTLHAGPRRHFCRRKCNGTIH